MNPNAMSSLVYAIQDDRLREAENYRAFKSQQTVNRRDVMKMLKFGLALSVLLGSLVASLSVAF